MFLLFNRYRFKDGAEIEGLRILERHARVVRSAPGCESVWLARGQHPATEIVVLAAFIDEASLARFEARLRSDPQTGGDLFSLLRLTTQPPELTQYEAVPIE